MCHFHETLKRTWRDLVWREMLQKCFFWDHFSYSLVVHDFQWSEVITALQNEFVYKDWISVKVNSALFDVFVLVEIFPCAFFMLWLQYRAEFLHSQQWEMYSWLALVVWTFLCSFLLFSAWIISYWFKSLQFSLF